MLDEKSVREENLRICQERVNVEERAIEGRAGREGVLLRLEKVWKDYSKWG